MPYYASPEAQSAPVVDCVLTPLQPLMSSRLSYTNAHMVNVPTGPPLMYAVEPGSSDDAASAAACSAPFVASTLYTPSASTPGSLYNPYSSPNLLDASPETVLKLAAQLPMITPDIPPLWDDSFEPLRSVYIDDVPPEATDAEILRLVNTGALERMRRFKQKRCVILVFLRHESALRFYAEFFMNAYEIRGHPLNIGWIPTPPMTHELQYAVDTQNASRNVYIEQRSGEIASLAEREEGLRNELSSFGSIESVYSLTNRNITFVYYTNVTSAVRAVQALRQRSEAGDSKWRDFTIAFGRDPCQSLLKLKKQATLLYLNRSPYDTTALLEYDQTTVNKAIAYQSLAAMLAAAISGGDANIGNRCIYIGNCPKNTKLVDICNTVRGGMIEKIRLFSERGICFVTFLEACAAAQFYATYRLHRLLINGKPVKVGWGKHSGALDPDVERAISRGVTRNVCIKDARPKRLASEPLATEAEILEKFASFGPIEQIKISPELGCIFITFTSISKTMRAVEWAKATKVIPNSHIQYGKDRCATFPRFLMARGSRTAENANPKDEFNNQDDPILIQFLRRELALRVPYYAHHQMPLAFVNPAVGAAGPMYYPQMPLYTARVYPSPATSKADTPQMSKDAPELQSYDKRSSSCSDSMSEIE